MGSKSRVVSEIAPVIQGYVNSSVSKIYYEPFCGGCNVIDHIRADKKFASDSQKYLIALYQNIHRIGELPASINKEHYCAVRDCFNKGTEEYEDWYVGARNDKGNWILISPSDMTLKIRG